jgi:hypothetical protein
MARVKRVIKGRNPQDCEDGTHQVHNLIPRSATPSSNRGHRDLRRSPRQQETATGWQQSLPSSTLRNSAVSSQQAPYSNKRTRVDHGPKALPKLAIDASQTATKASNHARDAPHKKANDALNATDALSNGTNDASQKASNQATDAPIGKDNDSFRKASDAFPATSVAQKDRFFSKNKGSSPSQ